MAGPGLRSGGAGAGVRQVTASRLGRGRLLPEPLYPAGRVRWCIPLLPVLDGVELSLDRFGMLQDFAAPEARVDDHSGAAPHAWKLRVRCAPTPLSRPDPGQGGRLLRSVPKPNHPISGGNRFGPMCDNDPGDVKLLDGVI